jgi:hypothetical protein
MRRIGLLRLDRQPSLHFQPQLEATQSVGPMPTRFLGHDKQVHGLDQTTVVDFWRWAYSDVLSNGSRSRSQTSWLAKRSAV